jgi:hypothetical protein
MFRFASLGFYHSGRTTPFLLHILLTLRCLIHVCINIMDTKGQYHINISINTYIKVQRFRSQLAMPNQLLVLLMVAIYSNASSLYIVLLYHCKEKEIPIIRQSGGQKRQRGNYGESWIVLPLVTSTFYNVRLLG